MKASLVASVMLLAAASGTTVTLHDSNVTFKRALQSCSGALGSVSFALNHARTAAAPGVNTDESGPDANGMMTVVFETANGSKTASVAIDQRNRSVSAKNVRTVMSRSVACVSAD